LAAGVTILLVNWNGEKYLKKFLPPLMQTFYTPFDVLLVDNNSQDNSLAFVKANYPEIRVIKSDVNLGFAAGNNFALPHVNNPYLVLLNTDVCVTPDWLSPLVAAAEANPLAAAIQPKIRAYHQPSYFEYAGGCGGWLDKWGYPFCRGRLFDTLEEDTGQYDDSRPIFWASGACMLVRLEVIRKIGLFEPDFFAHWEEIDFCWRAQNYGYSILAVPQSLVFHVGGGTLAKSNPQKSFLNFRNSLLCMVKNLPFPELCLKLAVRWALDYVVIFKNLLEGKTNESRSILYAHWAFLKWLPIFWRKRKSLPQKRLKLLTGVYYGSVVWAYFIAKKNSFHQLED
jgi:GT2 family glycosyltransferase